MRGLKSKDDKKRGKMEGRGGFKKRGGKRTTILTPARQTVSGRSSY